MPIDEICALRIRHESDTLMANVMEEMKLPIPRCILHRRLKIKVETQQVGTCYRLTALGIDSEWKTPVTFLRSLKLDGTRRGVRSEPFALSIREALVPGASQLKLELEFMSHYNEPNVELTHLYRGDEEVMYLLNYDPQTGKWTVDIQDGGLDQIPCSLPGVS
jgi:mono-ADP-ribosyltransferase sirtuin 6